MSVLPLKWYDMHTYIAVQWNLSNLDTNGTEESVFVSEVSSFQKLKCMARVVVGAGKGVLFGDVSLVQVCPYRGVPLYKLYKTVF